MENVVIPMWLFRNRKIVARLRLLLAGLLTISDQVKSDKFRVGEEWLCKFTNRQRVTIAKNFQELSQLGLLDFMIEEDNVFTITINRTSLEIIKNSIN